MSDFIASLVKFQPAAPQHCPDALQRRWSDSKGLTKYFALPRGLSKDHSWHIQGQSKNFQNLILKAKINAVRRTASERFAVNTGKIETLPELANAGIRRKTEENYSYECSTPSQRNLNQQNDAEMGLDWETSIRRSRLPHMAGAKKLSAFVLPLPRTCGEDRPSRVVGVLAFVQQSLHPCLHLGEREHGFTHFPASSRAAPVPLPGA